ncbi:meiotic chromosome segregation protein [Schizosaccharomyces cryophilus OY26]|uniref:Meiotic chromosome segregation protein n=1 Tax=Schizosaccharomyces cryophilus (strain OY26 / ATCC MYA-4695 / CBS 11777 / NBRC 106824 / NRRL Y48691) TaxID=653667 RepID=S9VUZ9_SCHCR|nr:meiotic chromosome segregation protein [Schizosaccharomyces cryophilus OY26]EPY50014.1 meiotic chromosome segregation protein [Schizosaccharomyces cryophilus OY26]
MATVANVLHYQVLWTSDKVKKSKVWKDGTMRFHTFNNHGILYDSQNRVIDESFIFNQKIQIDAHLELNRTLIYVEDLQATTSKEIPPLPSKSATAYKDISARPLYLTKPFHGPSRSSSFNPPYQQPSVVKSTNEAGQSSLLQEEFPSFQEHNSPHRSFSSSKPFLHGNKSAENGVSTAAKKNFVPPMSSTSAPISSEKTYSSLPKPSHNSTSFKPPFKNNLTTTTVPLDSLKHQVSKPTRIACIPVLRRPRSPSNVLQDDPLENFDEDNIDSDFFSSPSPDYESTPPFLNEPMDAGHPLGNSNPLFSSSLSEPMLTSSGSASGPTLPPCDGKTDTSPSFEKSLSFPSLENSFINRNETHAASVKRNPVPRLPMPRLRKPVGKRNNFSNVTVSDPSKNLYERAMRSTSMLAAQPNLPESTDPEIPNSPEFLESDNEEDSHTERTNSKNPETAAPITLPNNKIFKPATFRPPSFVSKPSLPNAVTDSNTRNQFSSPCSVPKPDSSTMKPVSHLHSALTKPSGPSLRTGLFVYGKYSKQFHNAKDKGKVETSQKGFVSSALPTSQKTTSKPFTAPLSRASGNFVSPLQTETVNNSISANSLNPLTTFHNTLSLNTERSEEVDSTAMLIKKGNNVTTSSPSSSPRRKVPAGSLRKQYTSSPIQRFSSECKDLPFVNSIAISSTTSKIKRVKLSMLRFKSRNTKPTTTSIEEEENDFI